MLCVRLYALCCHMPSSLGLVYDSVTLAPSHQDIRRSLPFDRYSQPDPPEVVANMLQQ